MANAVEEYALRWGNHANNFTECFKGLLERKELIDVTLVADGYLFDAHRLVLSALSPYFQQMFTQMPVNQRAYVVLKDVSRQVLHNLITYIYCGEVDIKTEDLEEFFSIARTLKIQGLEDGNDPQPVQKSRQPKRQKQSTYSAPSTDHGGNYSDQNENYYDGANEYDNGMQNMDGSYEAAGMENSEWQQSEYSYDDSYENDDYMNNDDSYMNETLDVQNNDNSNNGFNDDGSEMNENDSKPKRAPRKADGFGFDIVADIRKSDRNKEQLFYNGYQYRKDKTSTSVAYWRCKQEKCNARANTKDINGVTMMKLGKIDHTHDQDEKTVCG